MLHTPKLNRHSLSSLTVAVAICGLLSSCHKPLGAGAKTRDKKGGDLLKTDAKAPREDKGLNAERKLAPTCHPLETAMQALAEKSGQTVPALTEQILLTELPATQTEKSILRSFAFLYPTQRPVGDASSPQGAPQTEPNAPAVHPVSAPTDPSATKSLDDSTPAATPGAGSNPIFSSIQVDIENCAITHLFIAPLALKAAAEPMVCDAETQLAKQVPPPAGGVSFLQVRAYKDDEAPSPYEFAWNGKYNEIYRVHLDREKIENSILTLAFFERDSCQMRGAMSKPLLSFKAFQAAQTPADGATGKKREHKKDKGAVPTADSPVQPNGGSGAQ